MHAHLSAVEDLRQDVAALDTLAAAFIATLLIIAVIEFVGRTMLKWDQKFDDFILVAVVIVGFGGILSQSRIIRPIGEGVRDIIRELITLIGVPPEYDNTAYTLVIVLIIVGLAISYKRSRDRRAADGKGSRILFIALMAGAASSFFAAGLGADVARIYINKIAIPIFNGMAWLLNWFV